MPTISQLLKLAIEHHRAGRFQPAEQLYRQILAIDPAHADALNLIGVVNHQIGRHDLAVEHISAAIRHNGNDPRFHINLGAALMAQNETARAVDCYRQAIRLQPDLADGHYNLGLALQAQERLDEAADCYRRAVQLDAKFASAHYNLGFVLEARGMLADAVVSYQHALRLRPQHIATHNNLGNTLKDLGQLEEAADCFQRVLQLKPDFAEAHSNLGNTLERLGRVEEALACFRRALELRPDLVEAYNSLGNALTGLGQHEEGIACLRRALQIKPDYVDGHSNLVYLLHFSTGVTSRDLLEAHRRWNRQHAEPLANLVQPHSNDRSPDRRLRVGYVSPDFRDHVVGRNIVPLFREHDRTQFEVFCYSGVRRPDALTATFQSYADAWRDVSGLTDERLAELVRADKIDVLVDLTLHMSGNRLRVFARKAAPVQITFAGYPGTTGLTSIDYRLTDPHLDPPCQHDEDYAENSIRLPDSFWCFDPIDNDPPLSALPALERGFVTFGCLNNFRKINAEVLRVWARVLRAVEKSRLVVSASEGPQRRWMLNLLEREGVAPERVTFVLSQPRPRYLELYREIDIGLDTLPYNGHTTNLDSLWMGVPVVTLAGETVVGRAGLSQLTNLRLPELIAHSPDEFVNAACKLAENLPRLAELRATLRDRMRNSPLMDCQRFARGVEAAYRSAWRSWCAGASPATRQRAEPSTTRRAYGSSAGPEKASCETQSTDSRRTLVLGTAFGYEIESIWVFVESLRRHYDGEVRLLVSSKSSDAFFDYLSARKINPVFFDCADWMVPHVQFSRFVRYGELLRASDVCYDRILLVDVSDIVFQGHPFEGAPDGDLLCFIETAGRRIADCRVNRSWIESIFGADALARFGDREISCSGTVIGSHEALLDYIDRLVGSVTMQQFIPLSGRAGHDQGIHNVLLHAGSLPRARRVANGVHVFTIAFVPDREIRFENGNILVAATGVKCPIVHQYNYKSILNAQVIAQYPLPGFRVQG